MQYVVAIVAVCPLRSEASHRSEMVSQLLFSEGAEVLEAGKDFTKKNACTMAMKRGHKRASWQK